MGAAASSEAALKRTLIAALGPGSSSTYARLPRDPRKWNVQQVGIWLREQEMPALVRTMESNNVDGRMLLDDCSDEDIANLVPFPPLRRKLTRSIDSLRQQSAEVQGPVSADMSEVSAEIQRSLDQLNDTMRHLAETIAQESYVASGKPPVAHADAAPRVSSGKGERKLGGRAEEDEGSAGAGRRDRAKVKAQKQGGAGAAGPAGPGGPQQAGHARALGMSGGTAEPVQKLQAELEAMKAKFADTEEERKQAEENLKKMQEEAEKLQLKNETMNAENERRHEEEEAEAQADHKELLDQLMAAARESGLDVHEVRPDEADGASSTGCDGKFEQPRMLVFGAATDSTKGLAGYMCIEQQVLLRKVCSDPEEQAIIDEVNDRSQLDAMLQKVKDLQGEIAQLAQEGNYALIEPKAQEAEKLAAAAKVTEDEMAAAKGCLEYVLEAEAGSNEEQFQNGWKLDCDMHTGEVLPDRQVEDGLLWKEIGSEMPEVGTEISNPALATALQDNKTNFSKDEFWAFTVFNLTEDSYIKAGDKYFKPAGGKRGMTIDDFVHHPNSVACGLTRSEVIAGRLYTTKAFLRINKPLRDLERKARNETVPLPVVTHHLNSCVKKLRTLHALSALKSKRMILYRGLSSVAVEDDFMVQGGTELAPMSTTEALGIALKYSARGNRAVLLRIISKNFMDRGSELTWLSAFPHEKEFLYPPTTYLRPLKSHPDFFTVGNCEFTIVDVECQLP